jgi:hypothetical protein
MCNNGGGMDLMLVLLTASLAFGVHKVLPDKLTFNVYFISAWLL